MGERTETIDLRERIHNLLLVSFHPCFRFISVLSNLLGVLVHLSIAFLDFTLELAFEVLVVFDVTGFLVVISIDLVSNCASLVVRERPALEILIVVLNINVSFRIYSSVKKSEYHSGLFLLVVESN